ncbi:methyl-accepting chemotaxis protein [Heliorestis convoluta]|uniref:Methyl-accepting chemotaxis (MCP) signaling domain protein n=1 Tax=Heliorestis convoluta TaxID=356322 RepID=A0A5Q2MVX4_9FIRM|nr:methyl-accepting chemotaxis protein [Heliorestis convoluta]QGG46444.1 methyl-accepting chemotaxis (MCP) signaling domain protein [Heliorestis convoluta]
MAESKTLLSPPNFDSEDKIGYGGVMKVKSEKNDLSARKLQEQRRRARTFAKQQQISERLTTASAELSSGVEESLSAVNELRQSMEEIAAGAQEASAASEESTAAVTQIVGSIDKSSAAAKESMEHSNVIQQKVALTAIDIKRLIEGVAKSAKRSEESAHLVAELENQAKEIGNIIETVVNIADQTNLLALNAAIEAARAGEYGSGFSVVADEVRTLAETSEKAANDIRQVIEQIQRDVKEIASSINGAVQIANSEVHNGMEITKKLDHMTTMFAEFVDGTNKVSVSINQLLNNTLEIEQGTKEIANTSEQQAAAATESQNALEELVKAMSDISQSALELNDMADDLKSSTDINKSAELLASAAEELSAAISQSSTSAKQILLAINMIHRGAEQQSTATEQSATSAQMAEREIQHISEVASTSEIKSKTTLQLLIEVKEQTEALITNISEGLETLHKNLKMIFTLNGLVRKIEKIVNTIDKVSIQTNMLAVNGAIEAAGAGEYGRGFAVVAGDIRNLALDSANNAENIKDLVRDIQDQLTSVTRDVELALEANRAEVEKARRITEEIIVIEKDAQVVYSGIVSINKVTTEIATAVEQAKKAIEQISTTARQATVSSKQAAGAGTEQEHGIAELAQAIEEIAAMADELQQ